MDADRLDRFRRWSAFLERRFGNELTFTEIRRAIRALSDLYVHRRTRLPRGDAFDGRGKRAAYALYFAPLHACALAAAVREHDVPFPKRARWLDLGCGTGAASIGLWIAGLRPARLSGIDRSGWAIEAFAEAGRALRLDVRPRRGRVEDMAWPRTDAIVAGWALNELDAAAREEVGRRLAHAVDAGTFVCIAEPVAKRPLRWWERWVASWAPDRAREDAWALPFERPESIAAFDRAARLDHRTLRLRTLVVPSKR